MYDATRFPCLEVLGEITCSAQNMLATTVPVRPCTDPCPYLIQAGYRGMKDAALVLLTISSKQSFYSYTHELAKVKCPRFSRSPTTLQIRTIFRCDCGSKAAS